MTEIIKRIVKWIKSLFIKEKPKYTMQKVSDARLHGAKYRHKGRTKGAFGKPKWMRYD